MQKRILTDPGWYAMAPRKWLRIAGTMTLALLLTTPALESAVAKDDAPSRSSRSSRKAKEKAKPKGRTSQNAGKKVQGRLQAAYELIGEEKYDEARAILEQALRKKNLRDVEVAQLNRFIGFTYTSADRYEEGIVHFKKAVSLGALDLTTQRDLQFNLAQLYMATEQFGEAAATLTSWIQSSEDPAPKAYYYLAIAYTQQEKIDEAIPPAKKAVELAERPKESWTRLLLNLYFQKQNYTGMLPLLEELVRLFPSKSYWQQLAAVYAELDDEKTSMAIQQLAHMQGYVDTDKGKRRLARMYLYHDMPYWAARLIKEGLENESIEEDADSFELLANAWITAREFDNAVEPLARAADLSDSGDIYARLGQVYLEREEYGNAIDAIDSAFTKGDLKNPGQAYLLLGICNFSADRFPASLRAFRNAHKFEKTKKIASQWLTHVENTMKIQEG